MKLIAPSLLSVLVLLTSSALADNTLAKFKGGIGVIPVSSGVGMAPTAAVVNRNIVRGVQPAGQPWVIRDLDATVKTDGSIGVKGRGLLLAGGDSIGFNAGASVFVTLLCALNIAHPPPGCRSPQTATSRSTICFRTRRRRASAPCS